MRTEIYADVVFAVNFFMDSFILYAAGKLNRKKIKLWRIGLGAFIAALLYCLLIFVPVLFQFYNLFTVEAAMLIAVFIAFIPKNIKEFLKLVACAHIGAFAIGGGGMALFYFTNAGSVFGNAVEFTAKNFSVNILITATCISYGILKFIKLRILKSEMDKQSICSITIHYELASVSLEALIDTGNTLFDPITKAPVIIAEFSEVKKCLPVSIQKLFDEKKQDNLESILLSAANTSFARRIRMIPFSSVGEQNGMLVGFRTDKIEIYHETFVNEKDYIMKPNAIVGVYSQSLSPDGGYQALLNPAFLSSK